MLSIQSNSLRSNYMQTIVSRTMKEIHDDIVPMFGPYATDAFITKNNQPYYTRDGMEVMESLVFDNELSNHIHHILFQAVYNQGTKAGDGTTTLAVLLTNLYDEVRAKKAAGEITCSFTKFRDVWNDYIQRLIDRIKKTTVSVTEDDLLSMLYTCTQDKELAVKIFRDLKDPIMNQAYIVPRKSNIATDFAVTTYNEPKINATRLFSVKPIKEVEPYTVIFHCNGMLDIAHSEVLVSMMAKGLYPNGGNERLDLNIVFLCNGITDVTRKTCKKLIEDIKTNGWDVTNLNNIAIYSIDDYRSMTNDEMEDLSTIITDENGIGGLVNSIVYEANLYQAFMDCEALDITPIESLETFDSDLHIITKLREMLGRPYEVQFDDMEGIRIRKPLGPVAQARYQELRKEIEDEKSPVRALDLNKRLRKTYGQFIEVEVGSKLLKDSQRKYELILDAITSSLEGCRYGIVKGCSYLVALKTLVNMPVNDDEDIISECLVNALLRTYADMAHIEVNRDRALEVIYDSNLEYFNVNTPENTWDDQMPGIHKDSIMAPDINVTLDGVEYTIKDRVIEPITTIEAILESSSLAMELALTEVFHISGQRGFMNNYLDDPVSRAWARINDTANLANSHVDHISGTMTSQNPFYVEAPNDGATPV